MRYGYVESISGVHVEQEKIDQAAYCAIEAILSVLHEEARTVDIIKYVLKRAKVKTDGAKVVFTKSGDKS